MVISKTHQERNKHRSLDVKRQEAICFQLVGFLMTSFERIGHHNNCVNKSSISPCSLTKSLKMLSQITTW